MHHKSHLHRMARHAPRPSLTSISAHTHRARRTSQTCWPCDSNRPWLAAVSPLTLRPRLTVAARPSRRPGCTYRPDGTRLACSARNTLQSWCPILAWETNWTRPSRMASRSSWRFFLAKALKFSSQTRVPATTRPPNAQYITRKYGEDIECKQHRCSAQQHIAEDAFVAARTFS